MRNEFYKWARVELLLGGSDPKSKDNKHASAQARNLVFSCLLMGDEFAAATMEVYTTYRRLIKDGGFDTYRIEAVRPMNPVDDPITKSTVLPSLHPNKKRYVASDPRVPMAVRRLFSTAFKLERRVKAPGEPYHAFLQCLIQSLAHKQFLEVIQLDESNDTGVWYMVMEDDEMRSEDFGHPDLKAIEHYIRKKLQLTVLKFGWWKKENERAHGAMRGYGPGIALLGPRNGAKL